MKVLDKENDRSILSSSTINKKNINKSVNFNKTYCKWSLNILTYLNLNKFDSSDKFYFNKIIDKWQSIFSTSTILTKLFFEFMSKSIKISVKKTIVFLFIEFLWVLTFVSIQAPISVIQIFFFYISLKQIEIRNRRMMSKLT